MKIRQDDPSRPWTEPGIFEVETGTYRIPLPMPNDHLRAVNVYAIHANSGLVLIDSGVAVPESRRQLETALEALDRQLDEIDRFLVTHIHYDHYAQALSLRGEFHTPVLLGHNEEPSLRALAEHTERLQEQYVSLRHHGAADIANEVMKVREKSGATVTGYPDGWLDDATEVYIGERNLNVLHTPGHTRGHVVFADDDRQFLFSGDHILPHITPSIAFEPAPPELPLSDYLESLRLVRERRDTQLLPAHGPISESVHARVDELLVHHEDRLSAAADAVTEGRTTALEVAQRLAWTGRGRRFHELDPFNQMLAVLETGAHLDLLVAQGGLRCHLSDGIRHYTGA